MAVWKIADGARVDGVTSVNVQVVGDEIFRLVEQHKTLDPKIFVQAARVPKSPLHPVVYRLSDGEAAMEHRLWIVRNLIKSVRAITEDGEETLEQRVYVNVQNGDTRGYMYIPTVMSDVSLRQQVLDRAKADLAAWRERYNDLQELADVFAVIDKTLKVPAHKPPRRKMQEKRIELQ